MSRLTAPLRSGALARRLGLGDATAIVISNVIGAGILTTPALVAGLAPRPSAMLAAWGVGGVLAWAGATAYAELAARYPRVGGEYVYIREAFGPLAAFLTGWTSFIAGFSGAIAANAVAAAILASRLVPANAARSIALPWPADWVMVRIPTESLIAVAVILALSLIHSLGLTVGRLVQNSLAVAKVVGLTLVAVAGVWIGRGPTAAPAAPGGTVGGWLLALIPVMFSYSGWNAATYVAEEVRHPRRNVPRALWAGTAVVVALYLMINLAYLCVSPSERAATINVAEPIARQVLGPAAATVVTLLTILILLSSTSAMVLAGPRVYFAMAQDGLFFSAAARVHPRFRTPAVAIFLQGACSAVLALTGTFERLVTYTGFAVVLFSGVAAAALIVLRRRAPCPSPGWRPRRLAPAIFVAAAAAITTNALYVAPKQVALGAMVIAAGVPIYWTMRRTHHATRADQGGHDESLALNRRSAHS